MTGPEAKEEHGQMKLRGRKISLNHMANKHEGRLALAMLNDRTVKSLWK